MHFVSLDLLSFRVVVPFLLLLFELLLFTQLAFSLTCLVSYIELKPDLLNISVLNTSLSKLFHYLLVVIPSRFLTEEHVVEHLVIIHTLFIL